MQEEEFHPYINKFESIHLAFIDCCMEKKIDVGFYLLRNNPSLCNLISECEEMTYENQCIFDMITSYMDQFLD